MTTATEEAKEVLARGEQIDLPLTKRLLDEAVAEKGADYVYTNAKGEQPSAFKGVDCSNLHPLEDGTWVPGCIVGTVFANVIGVENVPAEGSASSTNEEVGEPFDHNSERLLLRTQMRQDQGVPWGQAVQMANPLFAN